MKYRSRRAQWRPSFQGTLQRLVIGHEVFQVLEDDHQGRARILETQVRLTSPGMLSTAAHED